MWQMYIHVPPLLPSPPSPPHPHPQEFLEQLLAKWSAPVAHYLITSTATALMQMMVGRRLSVLKHCCHLSLKSHFVISNTYQSLGRGGRGEVVVVVLRHSPDQSCCFVDPSTKMNDKENWSSVFSLTKTFYKPYLILRTQPLSLDILSALMCSCWK